MIPGRDRDLSRGKKCPNPSQPWNEQNTPKKAMTKEETKTQRLLKVASDPRFRRPSKKQSKLPLDDRFKSMFREDDFSRPVSVDKYGRKVESGKARKELKRFYSGPEGGKEGSEEGERDSLSEPESDPSTTSTEGEEMDQGDFHPLTEQDTEQGESTRRLAIVNLDWDQIKAVDIYILLHGFKPATGVIHSVTIYPSQFGRERMAKESLEGPPRELFQQSLRSEESSDGGENPLRDPTDDGQDFDSLQLRRYQLERLKYYYAVVVCDSVATAQSLYHECDGKEFETSSNFLDIRYIPDGVSFEDDQPHDMADALPTRYKPKADLVTHALQRSKVKLTWDEDDADRRRLVRKDFSKLEDDDDSDVEAYLASATSDEDNLEERRKLLLAKDSDDDVFGRKTTRSDGFQIVFPSGFQTNDRDGDKEAMFDGEDMIDEDDFLKKASTDREMEADKVETPFDKYLRVKAEKRAAKRQKKALAKNTNETDARKQRKRSKPTEEELEQRSKLEALMKPVGGDKKHFSIKELVKSHTKKNKKTDPQDDFKVDVSDPRFQAVFQDADYAITPTDSQYKPTVGMSSIMQERQKRYKESMTKKHK